MFKSKQNKIAKNHVLEDGTVLIVDTVSSGHDKAFGLGEVIEYDKVSLKWKTVVLQRGYLKEIYIDDIVYINSESPSSVDWIKKYRSKKFR